MSNAKFQCSVCLWWRSSESLASDDELICQSCYEDRIDRAHDEWKDAEAGKEANVAE